LLHHEFSSGFEMKGVNILILSTQFTMSISSQL